MVTNEDIIAEQRPVATYAQPLSRLQVSWGSVLAGTFSMLAVSLIAWSLCLAIIFSAMHASVGSVKGALIAAFVTSIVTTLIGAFVGGMVAGYLPGNPRRFISVAHGFIAWAVAFVLSAFVNFSVVSGVTRTATQVLTATTSAAVQSAGAAVGGAAGGALGFEQKARSLLETLGYSPSEASSMVDSARTDLQNVLRGQGPKAQQLQTGAQQAAVQVRGALDTVIDWMAGFMWAWWATWLVSAGLAMGGALLVLERTRRVPERERASGSEPLQVTTLRPARTMP
jgi:large-conductance mechanosensitive channel